MKIIIEELDKEHGVISVSDGDKSVSIVEAASALDFHLAKNMMVVSQEMLNRHISKELKK